MQRDTTRTNPLRAALLALLLTPFTLFLIYMLYSLPISMADEQSALRRDWQQLGSRVGGFTAEEFALNPNSFVRNNIMLRPLERDIERPVHYKCFALSCDIIIVIECGRDAQVDGDESLLVHLCETDSEDRVDESRLQAAVRAFQSVFTLTDDTVLIADTQTGEFRVEQAAEFRIEE